MKTIRIPEYNNPFIVNINNKEYTYKAGDTIEVPDEVAEAIEDALELVPKPKRYLSQFAQFVEGGLTEVTGADLDGITAVAACSFYFYRNIKKVTIPNSVSRIGTNAFYSCSELETVIFEDGELKSIEGTAFEWCSKLSKVYLPTKPPTLSNANAFGNIKADCVFYCKTQESLEAYQNADIWSTLTGTYSFVVEE
jgi:hypothetical protein